MKREEMLTRLENGESPLELSIEKWRDIIDGTGKDLSDQNCALCEKNSFPHKSNCDGCPVKEKTGENWCLGTPYIEYTNQMDNLEYKSLTAALKKTIKKEALKAAKAEVAFLESLRK